MNIEAQARGRPLSPHKTTYIAYLYIFLAASRVLFGCCKRIIHAVGPVSEFSELCQLRCPLCESLLCRHVLLPPGPILDCDSKWARRTFSPPRCVFFRLLIWRPRISLSSPSSVFFKLLFWWSWIALVSPCNVFESGFFWCAWVGISMFFFTRILNSLGK